MGRDPFRLVTMHDMSNNEQKESHEVTSFFVLSMLTVAVVMLNKYLSHINHIWPQMKVVGPFGCQIVRIDVSFVFTIFIVRI